MQHRRTPIRSAPLAGPAAGPLARRLSSLAGEEDSGPPAFLPQGVLGAWTAHDLTQEHDKYERVNMWPSVYGPRLGQAGRGFFFPGKVGGGPGVMVKTHAYATDFKDSNGLTRPAYNPDTGLHLFVAFSYDEQVYRDLAGVYKRWYWCDKIELAQNEVHYKHHTQYGGSTVAKMPLPGPGSYVAHLHFRAKTDGGKPVMLETFGGPEKAAKQHRRMTFEAPWPNEEAESVWYGFSRGENEAFYLGSMAAAERMTEAEVQRLLAWFAGQHGGIGGLPAPPPSSSPGGLPWWLLGAAGIGGLALWTYVSTDEEKQQTRPSKKN